ANLLLELGRAELAAGEPAAALAPLREGAALRRAMLGAEGVLVVRIEGELARAHLALGNRDSALACYRLAAATWERARAQPNDPEWREAYGGLVSTLYGRYACTLLDPARGGTSASRASEAFTALQPFRARTLEDALHGAAGRTELPRVSLGQLQKSVLSPGEALADCFASPETSIVIVVTRDSIQAAGAPGAEGLSGRLSLFRDLLASENGDARLIAGAARSLGADVFGGVSDLLHGCRTVLISAGGLAAYPLGMLQLPGENAPLAMARNVALVPSATLLAEARTSEKLTGREPGGLLALSRETGPAGLRLNGVAEETRWLRAQFPHAVVRTNDGRRELEDMLRGLGSRDVLHISAHARRPAAAPWRAGFLLGRGDGEDAYLTASRISQLRLPARICVLASCSSAGEATGAEGMPNLAAAWLAGGCSAVIASQWAMSDETTADFVKLLYSQVGAHRSAGDALREAQRASRERHGPSSTASWAGFVLVGDPATPFSLDPQRVSASMTKH
ncbi:MAG: CHAT domain-containing protein, partial [Candidatus Eiseniibacteriota bacterium]